MNAQLLGDTTGFRAKAHQFIENPFIQNGILVLIVINAITLGLETVPAAMQRFSNIIHTLDLVILSVFVLELLIRLYVYREKYFNDPWRAFDFVVVSIALVPATGQLAVLRALRVLRVLRIITIVPSMRRVVGALLSAIPGLTSIALVLGLIYYVFAVIATNLFAAEFPEWFGHLGRSFYTLFQIMTLESWSMGIARPVMETFPYAWAFFIPFILVATFTMLNLFIAIIVNAMQTFTEQEKQGTVEAVNEARDHIEEDMHTEMRALRREIAELKSMIRGQYRQDP
ncbi:voltage-gated sodium channel subunit [Oleiphilus messinensis]|uniref:Voltage-gated sodium channel subunit n=1 Tax=Oleiphilus messinensis TaxID=141451 RepID=A0A1Y0IGL1_9GAMM|nr:ion transporter [Oleiphilus messinensis]ARU58665.1 voltage-gated sodium channel subunit [Oleiphilus messinensis]